MSALVYYLVFISSFFFGNSVSFGFMTYVLYLFIYFSVTTTTFTNTHRKDSPQKDLIFLMITLWGLDGFHQAGFDKFLPNIFMVAMT